MTIRLAIGLFVLLAACSSAADDQSQSSASVTAPAESPATTATPTTDDVATTEPTTTTTTSASIIPQLLSGFGLEEIELDGAELLVAVADTPELRRQGLMNLDDLGDLDGMLFIFPEDTTTGFWMKNTLIPLDIAFFTPDGAVVDRFEMEPCITESCPTYRPSGAYRFALEMPAGSMPIGIELLER